jgi:hypothetical protein
MEGVVTFGAVDDSRGHVLLSQIMMKIDQSQFVDAMQEARDR